MGLRLSTGIGPLRYSTSLTGGGSGGNGLVKLCMMLLFLPLILLYLAVKHGYPHAKRFYSHPDPETRRKRRMYTAVALAGYFAVSIVTALARTHYAGAVLSVVVMFACTGWALVEYRKPKRAEAAALAARAEAQHQQWFADDPRGTYGPDYTPLP